MKQFIYIILTIILVGCTETRIDMPKSSIIGTWYNISNTFTFDESSFKTTNELGTYYGVYFIAEHTIICQTQNNSTFRIEVHKQTGNKALFKYWLNTNNIIETIVQRNN